MNDLKDYFNGVEPKPIIKKIFYKIYFIEHHYYPSIYDFKNIIWRLYWRIR